MARSISAAAVDAPQPPVDGGIDFGRGSRLTVGRTLSCVSSDLVRQQPVSRWQQALLPGALHELPAGRSVRDWVVDTAMFLLAVGIGAACFLDERPTLTIVTGGLDLLFGGLACLALWQRRRYPLQLAIATSVLACVFGFAAGAALIAYFSALLRVSTRWVVWLSGLAICSALIYPAFYPGNDTYVGGALVGLICTAVVLGWGLYVRVQRELFRSLRERTARAESEQRLRVEQAREAERRRIAREMHDVLAHRVSLLSLHAGALEFRPDAPPEEIAEAAGVVRASARQALEDLRGVIGVLREDRGADGGAGAGDRPPEPPQPTLARIPSLVEQSRAAGMKVGCTVDLGALDGANVGDALGRTAYRIVQEGLTNAHKHAPAAAVEIAISGQAGEQPALLVEVVSRPAVGVRQPAGGADTLLPGAGAGLIGLSERVALAGGTLTHGPDERGDFVLRAVLPVGGAA
jgi:signal transduction histidine kinase